MYKILVLIGIGLATTSFGQETKGEDYFVADSDTTYCSNLSYKLTAQSYLAGIKYIDDKGQTVSIDGRKMVPNITTFYIDGKTIDRIPQKVNKPNGYVKFVERVVDGKLKVHYYYSVMSTTTATTAITKFFIKMPDGTYYDINNGGHRKKYIIPYLKKCKEFVKEYKGDYSKNYEEFTKMIELYNSLCN